MRNELENIQRIENYLIGKMTPEEVVVFEAEMLTNEQLRIEVAEQKKLIEGIKSIGLRQQVLRGFRNYKLIKAVQFWSAVVLIISGIAIVAFILSNKNGDELSNNFSSENTYELPEFNENGEKLFADADKYLPTQKFKINSEQDQIIETEDGIVFAIPANAFTDENGNEVKGEIEVEIKEAIQTADIIKGGLSTYSGDRLLETGGMFYFNAKQNDKNMKIKTDNPVHAEIPTDQIKPGMQLFDGVRKPDGTIDWQNPKPLNKDLIPVDIMSLNFYPPRYEDTLLSMGIVNSQNKYKDSLYYSFGRRYCFNDQHVYPLQEGVIKNQTDSVIQPFILSDTIPIESCYYGIDPAKIKTIWNKNFNNTNIATREFEERMKLIHSQCDNAILELYIKNLDKKLCSLDSIAANMNSATKKQFLEFAARGDGKVMIGQSHIEELQKYYTEKSITHKKAVEIAHKNLRDKFRKDNEKAMEKNLQQNQKDIKRKQDNFNREFNINLDEAYRQLGKKRPAITLGTPTFGATITTTGWKNVDQYVLESTLNRTTLNYTDPQTGKKAIIRYEEFLVKVKERSKFDAVFVYILPDSLNSFMRLKENSGLFKENLNELFKHQMLCLGYKDKQAFLFDPVDVVAGNYGEISLNPVSNKEMDIKLNSIKKSSHLEEIKNEFEYRSFEAREKIRLKKIKQDEEFRRRVASSIFSCSVGQNMHMEYEE